MPHAAQPMLLKRFYPYLRYVPHARSKLYRGEDGKEAIIPGRVHKGTANHKQWNIESALTLHNRQGMETATPDQVLFLDSCEEDIKAVQKYGYHTVLFRPDSPNALFSDILKQLQAWDKGVGFKM